jgi:hypothetical protein
MKVATMLVVPARMLHKVSTSWIGVLFDAKSIS